MDAHETTIYTAVLISGIIIGSIIIFFFISIVGHQRRIQKLHQSKILAEIKTLENERRRIAADLHDELGPILASVKFKLFSVEVQTKDDEMVVDNISSNLDELIVRMQGISNDLLPHALLHKGLVTAMEESIERVSTAGKVKIKFAHQAIPKIPHEQAVNIYRILQEIIHNTLKHAGAGELRIEMKMANYSMIILTEDDGIGFDYKARAKEPTGLGLRNLLSRTEVLGGKMYIESKKGNGTKYTFEIPITKAVYDQ